MSNDKFSKFKFDANQKTGTKFGTDKSSFNKKEAGKDERVNKQFGSGGKGTQQTTTPTQPGTTGKKTFKK